MVHTVVQGLLAHLCQHGYRHVGFIVSKKHPYSVGKEVRNTYDEDCGHYAYYDCSDYLKSTGALNSDWIPDGQVSLHRQSQCGEAGHS